jgi:glycosyltransferase involved in cell wall biosynthesis
MRQGSTGERGLRAIEAHLIRHADAVVALLPGIRDYIDERGLSTERVTYIPNGVDLTAFEPPGATEVPVEVRAALDALARHRAEGRFVIGYTGALGRVNRVDVIVRAAAIVEQRGSSAVGVVILGDGPERAGLEQDRPADVVTIGPPIPRRYVPLVLAAVDAAVVHATATPVYRYGISFNKLFDYMAASRPVISACSTAFDPVLAAGSGIVVRPDDPEALADAFLAMSSLPPEERMRMGAAGRAFVEREHDMVQLGARLAETIEQAIGRRTGPSAAPRSGRRRRSGEPDSQEPVE